MDTKPTSTKVLRLLGSVIVAVAWRVGAADAAPSAAAPRPDGQINAVAALKSDLAPGPFHFVILSDRFGGERPGVFPAAIDKAASLQPDFVMTVGDLVEGDTPDEGVLNRQWDELNGFAANRTGRSVSCSRPRAERAGPAGARPVSSIIWSGLA